MKTIYYSTIILKIKDEESYWISKRINPMKSMYELWQTPGGHINENETSIEAAQRELEEETGIQCNKENLIKYCTWKSKNNQEENREKGQREVDIFLCEMDIIIKPKNKEPFNQTDWRLEPLWKIMQLEVINSLKEYICEKIRRHIVEKEIICLEGTIGAGKTTITNYFPEEYKIRNIPEVTISEKMKDNLKIFYENKIKFKDDKERLHQNTYWFQQEIIIEYFKVLQYEILEKPTDVEVIVFDRNQRSTKIFSEFNGLTKEEIVKLGKNDEYYDQIINKATILYIKTSNKRMKKNLDSRQREQEKSISLDYCKELRKFYKKKINIIYPSQKVITVYNKENLTLIKSQIALKKQLKRIIKDKCIKNENCLKQKPLGNIESTKSLNIIKCITH